MSFREYQRRIALPLAGLGLAAYYGLVFVPLRHKAEALEPPLQKAWQKLSASLERPSAYAIDFLQITNQLRETRQALALLENAKQKAVTRLELSEALRARLNTPFQLVEYADERSKQLELLGKLARQQGVTVEAGVFAAFPEQTADVQQPALLWAQLSFVGSLLTTALQSNVVALHSLDVPLPLTDAPPPDPERVRGWSEIPLQVEFTASFAGAARLVQSLPLRADELRAAGLPEAPNDKPPLFIDRLVIKKQSPERPDEVRVFVRAVGFVFRE